MDYQPQTMTTTEMDAELERMVAAAKEILQSVESNTDDTIAILNQIESRVASLYEDMNVDMEALAVIEQEAEEEFDILILEQAVDIAD